MSEVVSLRHVVTSTGASAVGQPSKSPDGDVQLISPVPSDSLTAFDRFIAVYPRQASIGTARGRWIWALAKVNNDHDLLIRAAAACAYFHQTRHTAIEFIAKPHAWLDAEGWLDRYELPKAPVEAPYDRREALRASAAKGNRFSADLLKRDYGEEI